MPSDQQKLYEYAINMAQLLSSDLPEDDATNQIGKVVRDTLDIVRKAISQAIPVHVPAILRSASIEFATAFSPGGNQTPQIKRISENDERVEASRRQPVFFPRRHATVVLRLPVVQDAWYTGPSRSCDCQSPRNAPTV